MLARYEFDSELYDPLGITVLYGSDAMLNHAIQNADFKSEFYLPNSPVAAADQVIQWGDLNRLKTLFAHSGFSNQLHTLDFFRLLMRQWRLLESRHSSWDEAFDLVNHAFDAMVAGRWGNELFCVAASMRCMPMLQRLMHGATHNLSLKTELWREPCHGADEHSPGADQSVGAALSTSRLDVAEYLLQQDSVEAQFCHAKCLSTGLDSAAVDSGMCKKCTTDPMSLHKG